MIKQNYVTFYSPGTFFNEEFTKEIDSWDVQEAIKMSKEITERHNSTPYGFQFITRGREDSDIDSHLITKSNMYYLGGTILTLADVKAKNDPADKILISNMEGNNWDRIIVNNNSWKHTAVFRDEDIVL